MYQEYLKETKHVEGRIFLEEKWAISSDCLLRVAFFDKYMPDLAYIVGYSEKSREYILKKFDINNGTVFWEKRLLNGGYGTPVVYEETIYMLSEFDTVTGIDKNSGEEVFSIKLGSRIRTSLNVFDNLVWVGCAELVIGIDSKGHVIRRSKIDKAFIYGVILKYQDSILVTGTKYYDDINESKKVFWILNNDTLKVMLEVPLGKGSIISTDTSGAWIEGDFVYLTNNNTIFKFNLVTGKFEWDVNVNGDCDRETVVVDENRLYYTTLNGVAGCLSTDDGHVLWEQTFTEKPIVSPISIAGGTALILADARVYCVDKYTGICLSRYPVGHTPYSMCSIKNDTVLIGGGEPPINGMLVKFQLTKNINVNTDLVDYFVLNNDLDSKYMSLTVITRESWDAVNILVDRLTTSEKSIEMYRIESTIFSCRIPLSDRNVEGNYTLPIELIKNGVVEKMVSIVIFLNRVISLPTRHVISDFVESVRQNDYFNSGSAISEIMLKKYGKNISQEELRKIIDYVKEKSAWGDADFQTWRLILKRILTSPAKTFEEFQKLEDDN